nr:DUF309 domain-containing protein [Paenibacillus sediminis]
MNYEPLYVDFLVYFNRDQDYFECHEVLEELWLKKGRPPIYKGLLQVAVALFHFRNNNIHGARKMMAGAAAKLADYPGDSLGIRLDQLLTELNTYLSLLKSYEEKPFPYYDLTIEMWDAELIRLVQERSASLPPNIPQRRKPERGDKHKARDQAAHK